MHIYDNGKEMEYMTTERENKASYAIRMNKYSYMPDTTDYIIRLVYYCSVIKYFLRPKAYKTIITKKGIDKTQFSISIAVLQSYEIARYNNCAFPYDISLSDVVSVIALITSIVSILIR